MNPIQEMSNYRNSRAIALAAALIFTAVLTGLVTDPAKAAPMQRAQSSQSQSKKGAAMPNMNLKSSAFQSGSEMPQQFTCEGKDLSPALQWGDVPPKTESLALIADDPDAPSGTFTHWVLFDLPPNSKEVPEGIPHNGRLSSGGIQGTNDFGKIGYGGPCPPAGKPHRYVFKFYALDTKLNLPPGAKRQEVERAIKGHTLAQTEIMAKYQRKGKAAA